MTAITKVEDVELAPNEVGLEKVHEAMMLRRNIDGAFLHLGKLLKEIRDDRLYEQEYDNFEMLLQDMRLTKGTASKLISVYEQFILKYEISPEQLSEIGYSSLYEIQKKLPEDATKKDVVEWVEKGKNLTRDDLKKELDKHDDRVKQCLHPDRYLISVCNDCGDRHRVYEDEE